MHCRSRPAMAEREEGGRRWSGGQIARWRRVCPPLALLLLVDWGGAATLHKLNRRQAIRLVEVAFAGVGHDAVITRNQAPTPLPLSITVNVIGHDGALKLKTYLCHYQHQGAEWQLELKAADEHDAKLRLANLARAHLDGELIAKVPSALGPVAVAVAWLRNTLRSTPSNPR